jgi:hypothetical protein
LRPTITPISTSRAIALNSQPRKSLTEPTMSKKGNTAEELALAMILEQRRKAKAEGKDKDKPVISPEIQKAFNDL